MKELYVDIIKEVAFFLINGFRKLVYLICTIFPINRHKIFVNYFDGKGIGDHPKYIIKELLNLCPDINVYWVFRGSSLDSDSWIHAVRPFSISAIYHQATSKIWISSVRMPYYSIKRKHQFYFQTWHGGLAFKRIEQECEDALSRRYKRTCVHDSKMIDYWVSSNDDNSKSYIENFWYVGGEILKVGSPRNDIFFKKDSKELEIIKEKYHINQCKIAMYAPTFRKDNSFKAYNLDLLVVKRLLEEKTGEKWKVIVRLHPRLAKKSSEFIKCNSDIIDGSKIQDIQEILAATDLLITDYSSIALDYMLTLNPVIIYASDIEEYIKDRDFHLRLEDTPFPIATNETELEDIIRTFDFTENKEKLKAFIKRYNFYDTGSASLKVAKIIIKKIEED